MRIGELAARPEMFDEVHRTADRVMLALVRVAGRGMAVFPAHCQDLARPVH